MSAPLLISTGALLLAGAGVPLLATNGHSDAPSAVTSGGSAAFGAIGALFIGQSNAVYWVETANDNGGAPLMASVAWYLRAASGTAYWSDGNTLIGGQGLYAGSGAAANGSFLNNPGDGSDPSTWQFGADGQKVAAYIAGLTSAQLASIKAIVLPWSESDSARAYSEKATYKAAAQRFVALIRLALGGNAASLPLIWWSAINSLGDDQGMSMHREVVWELANDASQNVWIAWPQTAEGEPRGCTYNPATGAATGGDGWHIDSVDTLGWSYRGGLPIARAIAAAAGEATALPTALGNGTGPVITTAHLSGATVTLTISHDAGNDLIVPLQANQGAGFVVMDGGSITAPGNLISAISCARLDATHLTVMLNAAPTNPASACRLYYPYGNNRIGRGNVVTDNASQIAKPSGWDISVVSGASYTPNLALQVPMVVSGGTATAGFPLT